MNINRFVQSVKLTVSMVIRIATTRDLLKKHITTPLYQNAYYLMISSALDSVLGFVFLIIAARLYSNEALGLGSAIIAALGLLTLLSELGLSIWLIRFLPGAGRKANDMLNTCITLSGTASIFISLIFLTGLGFWSPELLPVRQHPVFFTSFVIFAIVKALQPLVSSAFLAKRNTKFILFRSVIRNSLNVTLVGFFAFLFNSAFGIFASCFLGAAITMTISLAWFLPKVQAGYRPFPKIKREMLKKLWRYSTGNYVGQLLLQMTNFVLPLMVINVLDAERSAYFYVAWTIVTVLFVIPSSLFNSLFAEASIEEKSFRTNVIKSSRLMLLLALPIIILVIIIADWLLLLFGQTYSDNGTTLLRLAILSVIPWGINYLYISIARVRKSVGDVIKVAGASTIISLGLSYFLALKMSLVGVGIGYLAGQSIVAIAVVFSMWRDYHSRPERTIIKR